jgi:hypothetical protein
MRAPFDDYASRVIAQHPHAIVAWWLMACYLYYIEHQSLLTDGYFDSLAVAMIERWDDLVHPHKHLIDAGDLLAGTGYALAVEQYPSITKSAARRLMHEGV